MFEIYIFGLVIVVVGGAIGGNVWTNDTLHPLIYLMPMVGLIIYAHRPVSRGEDCFRNSPVRGLLRSGFNLACATALAIGYWWGVNNAVEIRRKETYLRI